MPRAVATFLMFDGAAEEAINFYVSLLKGSEIRRIEHYGTAEPGKAGSVKKVDFTLAGHEMMAIDSPIKQAFTFTPSISIFVECEDQTNHTEPPVRKARQPRPITMPFEATLSALPVTMSSKRSCRPTTSASPLANRSIVSSSSSSPICPWPMAIRASGKTSGPTSGPISRPT